MERRAGSLLKQTETEILSALFLSKIDNFSNPIKAAALLFYNQKTRNTCAKGYAQKGEKV